MMYVLRMRDSLDSYIVMSAVSINITQGSYNGLYSPPSFHSCNFVKYNACCVYDAPNTLLCVAHKQMTRFAPLLINLNNPIVS